MTVGGKQTPMMVLIHVQKQVEQIPSVTQKHGTSNHPRNTPLQFGHVQRMKVFARTANLVISYLHILKTNILIKKLPKDVAMLAEITVHPQALIHAHQ